MLLCFFFCFSAGLTQALNILGKCSTTKLHSPSFFCFCYFSGMVLCFCLGYASDPYPPTHSLPCTGITEACHHAQLIQWGGFSLPGLAWNWDPLHLYRSSNRDYRGKLPLPLHCPPLTFLQFFFLEGTVTGELRTLCLLGKCSTTWAMLSVLFALVLFLIGSYIFAPG
jgi:hypothetical protein